ncbi:tetratricopeptide repeat protein [Polluticaenibacter yanchengensis]|uniref:Tetratricopeptide repeat protein n=1 Tax=Polluticaenibacter yanchengensis TaxID=3014562 RepID=A0ABT4UGI6_9BACT|nr:tetratricopeptide repeat protein [Chitinophagaceae bacterium LY-5]
MTGDNRLSKVEILFQQKKYTEAEKILQDLLREDAGNIDLLYMLAEVNLQQDKSEAANHLIDSAIGLSPDTPQLFYVKSRIAIQLDNYNEAEKWIYHALELDPYNADYFSLLASIKLSRKQYHVALEYADKALEIDAENLLALNTRSTALIKLNKKEEAFETIEGALREDPNNAYTHANYGWSLLEKGDHKKALEHFKESLKTDPDFEYAQNGMLEAIKAGNPIYRAFLKYAFWMNNLTAKYQWGVIIGIYLSTRVLNYLATSNTALQPYLTPVVFLLIFFAFSTWIITPVSNLFLRLNKYGQFLLDRKEKMSSNFVAGAFTIFLTGIILYFLKSDNNFLALAAFGFIMMVPYGAMFAASRYKNALLYYAIAMTIVGVVSLVNIFSNGEIYNLFTNLFIIGFILFQLVANFLMIKEDNK